MSGQIRTPFFSQHLRQHPSGVHCVVHRPASALRTSTDRAPTVLRTAKASRATFLFMLDLLREWGSPENLSYS